ncbi:MAG TPA: hypothetical protein VNO50_20395 [Pyrinomonadaceae bacterium]|nr:hypothetical protein [Pyrinomonadaceae bacterium]
MKKPSTSLVHILIGKSILETLLVGTLAVFTYITILPPYFHGWGEITETGVSGWAVNHAEPWARVEIQLFIDGRFIAQSVANKSRPDVLAAGWSKDEWHGYVIPISSLAQGTHEARVYALHHSGEGARKSLQLLGSPIPFSIDANGKPVGAGH